MDGDVGGSRVEFLDDLPRLSSPLLLPLPRADRAPARPATPATAAWPAPDRRAPTVSGRPGLTSSASAPPCRAERESADREPVAAATRDRAPRPADVVRPARPADVARTARPAASRAGLVTRCASSAP